jgi:hypothetical protein
VEGRRLLLLTLAALHEINFDARTLFLAQDSLFNAHIGDL